jgi:hypothetical protein
MTSDPFESPKLLIEGARDDILQFDAMCESFLNTAFGVIVTNVDPKTLEKVVKYRVEQKPPGRLRTLAGNALNAIRHSLDQAVNCATGVLGGKAWDNYFPFAKDATTIDNVIKDNCKRVPASLIPILKGFKPYGGGDDLLYSLNRLVGPNKHQVVVRMDMRVPNPLPLHFITESKGPIVIQWKWDGENGELEIARISAQGHIKCEAQTKLPLFVAIGGRKISRGEPATTLLNAYLAKAETIVSAIESVTYQLSTGRGHDSPPL